MGGSRSRTADQETFRWSMVGGSRPRSLCIGANAMEVASENALLNVVDQIYESIERPGLWPETIYAIGGLIGGGRPPLGVVPRIVGVGIDPGGQARAVV